MKGLFPLTDRELDILSYLYQFRILSLTQIYEKWYRFSGNTEEETQISSCRTMLTRFEKKKGYIQSFQHPISKERCYMLTKDGLAALRVYGITFIGTKKKYFSSEDFISLSRLTLNERLYSHQLCLNQFILDFEAEHCPVSWEYCDEKFVSSMIKGVRPDGILKVEDTYYFLEMDMDTERKKALDTKWQNYRMFLKSKAFHELEGRIKVLFLINSYSPEKREDVLRKSMFDGLYDKFCYKFDAYFGTTDEMRRVVLDDIFEAFLDKESSPLPNIFDTLGFQIKHRRDLKNDFSSCSFDLFIKKDSENELSQNEFFVCDFRNSSMSVLHDINLWNRTKLLIENNTKRVIPYIIVCDSLEKNLPDLINIEVPLNDAGIFYTTVNRLKQMPLCHALIHLDHFGNVSHFEDDSLINAIHETTLPLRKKI